MATIIQRDIKPEGGSVVASVYILSKDPNDDFLAQKYGDVYVDPSGTFTDSSDGTSFIVSDGNPIGILLSQLPNQKIISIFSDQTIDISIRLQQASVWTLAIAAAIASGITKLRSEVDTISGSYTLTV